MLGKLDSEVIEKFKIFQQMSGKYGDLDIEDVRFENTSLNNTSLITMGQSPEGKYLNKNGKGKPFFQGKTDYGEMYLNKPSTWTVKSKKDAKEGDILISLRAPAGAINIANVDLSIGRGLASIRSNRDTYTFYLYYYLKNKEIEISNDNDNGGFFSSMNKDYLYDISIPIPKNLNETYTTYKIQEIIVEFLEYNFDRIERIRKNIDGKYKLYERLKKSLIPSTFIKDYVKVAFGRYSKENDIGFNIADVEFEIKRIHSDIKDDPNVICKKRMGFTPETDVKGDINWFKVKDLREVDGLYINDPNSQDKTTMKLIKEKVDKKNTGKSEKLISIKKNDILISFKLTVGVVKIYNSSKPLYCNEAIDILTVDENITDSRYIAYNCILEYPKYGTKTNNGKTLNDDDKKEIKIFIPKNLENYTSLEIQKIIADFIEYTENRLQKEFDKMDEGYDALNRLHKTFLARTFSLIDWGVE